MDSLRVGLPNFVTHVSWQNLKAFPKGAPNNAFHLRNATTRLISKAGKRKAWATNPIPQFPRDQPVICSPADQVFYKSQWGRGNPKGWVGAGVGCHAWACNIGKKSISVGVIPCRVPGTPELLLSISGNTHAHFPIRPRQRIQACLSGEACQNTFQSDWTGSFKQLPPTSLGRKFTLTWENSTALAEKQRGKLPGPCYHHP